MFTGIITDIGTILAVEKKATGQGLATGRRVAIATEYDSDGIASGASIACAGVCLTVTEKGRDRGQHWFAVEISEETLACTTLGSWREGMRVNLERALKMGDELGGHLVAGHVDGVAEVVSITPRGEHRDVAFVPPPALLPFIAAKGSVALDGVSLTVNRADAAAFTVNLVPHTLAHTTLGALSPGAHANLEIDLIARYAARLLRTP